MFDWPGQRRGLGEMERQELRRPARVEADEPPLVGAPKLFEEDSGMGQHKTRQSVTVITSIASLGAALGYDVRSEWDIPGTGPHPEQIDLAFFIATHAELPAFAVEVDSADVPASMSNAMKIFGKTTRDLVKPFFVFHIFLNVAQERSRRRNAETAFSTQNYCTYNFAEEEQTFLIDLIDRHRAINSDVDLVRLAHAIDDPVWDSVDRYVVLNAAWRDTGITLADIARISISTTHMQCALVRAAASQRITELRTSGLSFAGKMFRWPLLLGLRAHVLPDKAVGVFEELREWQEGPEIIFSSKNSCLGLSQEFDFAIAELAPPIFCLVAMLFSRHALAARTLCQQLLTRATDGTLTDVWVLYALLWCAIAGVKVGADEVAERAIARINILGGLPLSVLGDVPQPMDSEDGEPHWKGVLSSATPSAVSVAILKEKLEAVASGEDTLRSLVAELLVEDEILPSLNRRIASVRLQ
jgi:hypothetical protein